MPHPFSDHPGLLYTHTKRAALIGSPFDFQNGNPFRQQLFFEPHLFDQGLGFGLVAPEIHIERHRMFVTALRENFAAESLRHFGIENTLLLEQREGIGRQHLGPLVTVIARSISAGKNRPERAEKGENVCTKVILWNWQEEH